MERKQWKPATNFQEGNERHCGNCARSFKHNNAIAKSTACRVKAFRVGKQTIRVTSTCSGNSNIYHEKAINF